MKIYVAGHRGLVGSALVRQIEKSPSTWIGATRSELNLFDRPKVFEYIKREKPDAVVIAAARVGGIAANSQFPVEFLTENLQIEMSILDACHAAQIPRVLFLGSSCIYPRLSPQPIKEEYLLTGELEPTNEAYALSKIAGIKLVQGYRHQYGHHWISAMPTNLYGPRDNYHPENSHVIPGLIYRFHKAKINNLESVTIWGTGAPKREFLYVDDLAQASVHVMNLDKKIYDELISSTSSHINVGSEKELTIKELAEIIREVINFKGKINFDSSKPDGSIRKLLNSERINKLGFKPKTDLKSGLIKTYQDYIKACANI